MKAQIILTILIISCLSVKSQDIYNFGNKNSIGFAANFIYADANSLGFKLNQKQIVFRRILTKKIALIANYTFSKNSSSLAFTNSPKLKIFAVDSLGNNLQETYVYANGGTATVRTSIINFGIRCFMAGKGAIAPYGRFMEFKVGYATIRQKIEEDNLEFKTYYDGNYYALNKSQLPNYGIDHLNILSFQMGFGVSKPIVKNLYFDWLADLNLNIPLWTGTLNKNVYYRDLYIYKSARILYGKNNLLRFNLGLHYAF